MAFPRINYRKTIIHISSNDKIGRKAPLLTRQRRKPAQRVLDVLVAEYARFELLALLQAVR